MLISPAKYVLGSLAGLLLSCTTLASAQSYQLDLPAAGTQSLNIYTGSDDYRSYEHTIIVAAGEDFTITRVRSGDSPLLMSGFDEQYYVEFSRLLILDCTEDMPSIAKRAELKAMWPMSAGFEEEIAIYGDEIDSALKITATNPLTIQGIEYETFGMEITDIEEGSVEEIKISPDLGVYVHLSYDGADTVDAIAVITPTRPFVMNPKTRSELGTCAGLLGG